VGWGEVGMFHDSSCVCRKHAGFGILYMRGTLCADFERLLVALMKWVRHCSMSHTDAIVLWATMQ
jgi:hypothetical protein